MFFNFGSPCKFTSIIFVSSRLQAHFKVDLYHYRSGFGMHIRRAYRRRLERLTSVVHNRNIDGLSLIGFSYVCKVREEKAKNRFFRRICGNRDGSLIPGPIPTIATNIDFFRLIYPQNVLIPDFTSREFQQIRFKLTVCFDVPNDPDA